MSPRRPLVERLWEKVRALGPDDCWPWASPSTTTGGYPTIRDDAPSRKVLLVHRVLYELTHGPIPEGHEVDHACHSRDTSCLGGPTCSHRRCCNPRHLEAVDHRTNMQRSRSANARKTHCPKGHAYTPENTTKTRHGTRRCLECKRSWRPRHELPEWIQALR